MYLSLIFFSSLQLHFKQEWKNSFLVTKENGLVIVSDSSSNSVAVVVIAPVAASSSGSNS